jgi:hypothetical protein
MAGAVLRSQAAFGRGATLRVSVEKTYERGVTLTNTVLQQNAPHIQRSNTLLKWSVTICLQ